MQPSFPAATNKHMERIFPITEWHEEEKHSEERKQSFTILFIAILLSEIKLKPPHVIASLSQRAKSLCLAPTFLSMVYQGSGFRTKFPIVVGPHQPHQIIRKEISLFLRWICAIMKIQCLECGIVFTNLLAESVLLPHHGVLEIML